VAGLLSEYRLVTVTGPGGVGKTRLAGAVAAEMADRFADGAWLVELAGVSDPSEVPVAVVSALAIQQVPEVSASEAVVQGLARQQVLLVLDNCEHMLTAVAQLCRALLPAADDVRVLATSREPIGVAGEARYRLLPLPVQDDPAATGGPAVALFTERARRADPRFVLDEESARLAGRIVVGLDGMPLAIELAAARVEVLGLSQLTDRLEDSLRLLISPDRAAPARHQSLAATVEWSYQLLDEPERRVFRHLALFPGPFTLEAAAAVAGPAAELIVLRLVDCSLLTPPRPGGDGTPRYLMLETLRAFGRDQLSMAGELPGAAAALARYALAVAEQAAASMRSSTAEVAGSRRLDAEDATVRQGLAWALEHDPAMALRMAEALVLWWESRGRTAEAYRLLNTAARLAQPGSRLWGTAQYWLGWLANDVAAALEHATAACEALDSRGPSPELASALCQQAELLIISGNDGDGTGAARRGLVMATELGHPACQADAFTTLSAAAYFRGDFGEAVRQAQQACHIDPANLSGTVARNCRFRLARALIETGEVAAAQHTCAEMLISARAVGDLPFEAQVMHVLTLADMRAGQLAAAWEHLGIALRLSTRSRRQLVIRTCLADGAELCALAGRWAETVTVWSAYLAMLRQDGLAETPRTIENRREELQRAAQALGPESMQAAGERGAAMTLDTAAEFLLLVAEHSQQAAPEPRPAQASGLSPREAELVTLVAHGQTDAQIAEKLYISVSTVRSHLDRIRDKSGCRRRADLTRLALQLGIV
jgi:predicted ATPase/DNA-binding CsgD family transcriptional regulator